MSRRTEALIALALVILVVAVYAPVRHFDFVQLDDPSYVTENPPVQGGLTLDGLAWAFTTGHSANWHPLTWISHMADVSMFGMASGPHHLVNLVLHAASTLLLFGVFTRMTGAAWRSALVAALFGVHPLHVESVAWVAERKDVLSTLFWMLTMWAYVEYVRSSPPRRTLFYALTLASFASGLMAKPMLVTLPFVLLLLDWWPLGRLASGPVGSEAAIPSRRRQDAGGRGAFRLPAGKSPKLSRGQMETPRTGPVAEVSTIPNRGLLSGEGETPRNTRGRLSETARPLVREKLPLFVMAAASSIVTVVVQQRGGAVSAVESESFALRVQNAVVSVAAYLRDTIWPAGLTIIYPFPASIPAWKVALAGIMLCAISFLAYRLARRHPWLPVGWLWYLGTLVPVAGLVRVGVQARADRYTYVPLIGVFIIIAWGGATLAARGRVLQRALPVAACIAVMACAVAAREQVGYWKDSVSLWTRATMLTLGVDAFEAHMSLGTSLGNQGRVDEARRHFAEAVHLRPQSDAAHYSLGLALAKTGRAADAAAEFNEALRLNPGHEAARRAAEELARRDRD